LVDLLIRAWLFAGVPDRFSRPLLESNKTMAKASVSTTPKPVTLKNLAAEIADQRGVSKREIEEILGEMIALIGKNLKKGNKLRIPALGIMQVRKRAARMGRNPQTGEAIKIKASKKIAFRAAKELKDSI
jgi:DNA-binding protein HU-beta